MFNNVVIAQSGYQVPPKTIPTKYSSSLLLQLKTKSKPYSQLLTQSETVSVVLAQVTDPKAHIIDDLWIQTAGENNTNFLQDDKILDTDEPVFVFATESHGMNDIFSFMVTVDFEPGTEHVIDTVLGDHMNIH